jgi:hypothetical protein
VKTNAAVFNRYSMTQPMGIDEDAEEEEEQESEESLLEKRVNEILAGVWADLEVRTLTRSTSKAEFLESNKELAIELAKKERLETRQKKIEKLVSIGLFFNIIISDF